MCMHVEDRGPPWRHFIGATYFIFFLATGSLMALEFINQLSLAGQWLLGFYLPYPLVLGTQLYATMPGFLCMGYGDWAQVLMLVRQMLQAEPSLGSSPHFWMHLLAHNDLNYVYFWPLLTGAVLVFVNSPSFLSWWVLVFLVMFSSQPYSSLLVLVTCSPIIPAFSHLSLHTTGLVMLLLTVAAGKTLNSPTLDILTPYLIFVHR